MPAIEHIPASAPRDLRCGCGYEWTEHVRPDDPAPPCPVCHSETVTDA